MVVINDITDGLEARLGTIDGLHPSSEWTDTPIAPGALVFPPSLTIDTFDQSMYHIRFKILVFVSLASGISSAARLLNDYMSTEGPMSITSALGGDRTLGVSSSIDLELTAGEWDGDTAGFIRMQDITYWGAYLRDVYVIASD